MKLLIILPLIVTASLGSDASFPTPAERQKSALNGRAPANPFQAQLDRASKKLTQFAEESSAMVEKRIELSAVQITRHLAVRMTLFYGEDSNRNRASVNGKLKRPGDSLMTMLPSTDGISGLTLEAIDRGSVTIAWTTDNGKTKRQRILSQNAKEAEMP